MMGTIMTIIWALTKIAFIGGLALGLMGIVVLLVHPIVLDVRLRASLLGQKVFVRGSYLFAMLGYEFEASGAAQRGYYRCLWVRRLHFKNQRKKEKATEVYEESGFVDSADEDLDFGGYEPFDEVPEKEVDDGLNEGLGHELDGEFKEGLDEPRDVEVDESPVSSMPAAVDILDSPVEGGMVEDSTEDLGHMNSLGGQDWEEPHVEEGLEDFLEEEEPEALEVVEVVEELVELPEPEEEVGFDELEELGEPEKPEELDGLEDLEGPEKPDEPDKPEEEKAEKKLNYSRILKNLKAKLNEKIVLYRKKIKLAERMWKLYSPIIKRFWNRAKKLLYFHKGTARLDYSLPEPHLTGMFYGFLAILMDFTQRFKVEFMPTPSFGAPGFYSNTSCRIVVRPMFLVLALIRLLFEFRLYPEYVKLIKKAIKK